MLLKLPWNLQTKRKRKKKKKKKKVLKDT